MIKTKCVFVMILMAVAAAAPVGAQDSESEGWRIQVIPLYLWAVDMGGTMTVKEQRVPLEVGFADAVDNLQSAFTIHFEAWKGDWGVLADFNWLDLGAEQMLPGPMGESMNVDLQQTIAEVAVGYEFDDHAFFIGGVRYLSLETTLTLPLGNEINPNESWTDAFVGFMWRPPLSKRWTFASRVDVGAGSSDVVWNAAAALDFAVSRHVALFFGYRYLKYDYANDDNGFGYDVSQHGPLAALRFFW